MNKKRYNDVNRQTGRQTPSQKPFFLAQGGPKTLRFNENLKSLSSHKTNTFLYNENVKISLSSLKSLIVFL